MIFVEIIFNWIHTHRVGYLKYYKLLSLKGQQSGKGQKISSERRIKLEESKLLRLIVGNNLKRRKSHVLNKICLGRGIEINV